MVTGPRPWDSWETGKRLEDEEMNKLSSEEGGGFHDEVLQKYTGGWDGGDEESGWWNIDGHERGLKF